MNAVWALGRAVICAAVDAAVSRRQSEAGPGGHPSGAGHLLLAAGLAAFTVAVPGLFIGLVMAGLEPGGP